jgi:hypothetical protein
MKDEGRKGGEKRLDDKKIKKVVDSFIYSTSPGQFKLITWYT